MNVWFLAYYLILKCNIIQINYNHHFKKYLQTPLSDERQSPWRFDPCQMELNDTKEEHMKILQGRVKVLWMHGSNEPNYKLIITVVSRGDICRHKGKHPCLKFG
jgi:hypothetical protein